MIISFLIDMKQLVVLFNSIIVPLLKGHPFSNDKVAL